MPVPPAIVAFLKTIWRFVDIVDVPSSYVGQSGKFLRVNAGANGLEFAAGGGGGGGTTLFELEVASPMMGATSEIDHSPYAGADVEVAVWEEVGLRNINGNIGAQWVRDAVDVLPLLGCSGHFTIGPNPFQDPFGVGCRVTDGIDPGGVIDQVTGVDPTVASSIHLDANVPDIAFLQIMLPSSKGRAVVVPWTAMQMTNDAYKVRRKPGSSTIVQFSFVGGPGSSKAWYQVRVPTT